MSFTRYGLALAAIVVAGCTPKPQPPQPISGADEAAVRELATAVTKTVSANDWDGWVATFEENAVMHPSNTRTLHGRANLLAWAKAFPPVEKLEFTDVKVWGQGDVAVLTSGYVYKLKDIPADTGKQLAVIRRQADGKWLTAAVSINSDLPVAAPPPTPPKK